jgi:dihydroneopterin aldolase
MKTTVSLKGLEFFSYHGYYPEERKAGNKFVIDIEVTLKSFDSNDDNINDTVNYLDLFKICEKEMANTQKLLETVVFNIISTVKNDLNNVTSGKVKLEKMSPQLGGKVEKATVEMEF